MKFLLNICLLACSFSLTAQTPQAVESYFNFFNNQHVAVNNLAMQYLQYSVHSTDMALVEGKRQAVVEQLNKSITEVEAMPELSSEDNLKATALEVFRSFLNSFKMDFVEVMQLKAVSQNSYESMETYFESRKEAEKKVDEAANQYLVAQKAFAEKHAIQLQMAEENKDVQDLNRLNSYHQAVFMRYFKVMMRNNDFMQALNEQDIEKIAAMRQKLVEESAQSLKSLQQMPAFKDETIYKNSAIALVEKVSELAKTDYSKLENIMKKPDADRTQEDVTAFNDLVQNMQTAVMPLNEATNKQGNELLKLYVPKPRMTKRA